MIHSTDPCPCQSRRAYQDCCEAWHRGEPCTDAVALMRSRYSAYVLELKDYLLSSWHPATRPASLEFDAGIRWLGLKILDHTIVEAGRLATVDFEARFRIGGQSAQRQREHSRFDWLQDRWVYRDGDFLAAK